VIVVIGDVAGRADESGEIGAAGFAATGAAAAAAAGSKVELVTRLGEDRTGDAVILALARAGVGHVATLRDPGRATRLMSSTPDEEQTDPDGDPRRPTVESPPGPALEPADVGLALRYLSDYRVIVVAHPTDRGVLGEAVDAAGWSGAHLVVVTSPELDLDVALPRDALAMTADPGADGVGSRVGRYAAAIDSGAERDTAYAALTGANGES
jgi:hypothetical protein